uniref:Stress-response A/B barrel domain-containing protein n=1 Tax=Aegilops tauschii subsp. strangulata TaxID=200361 RepID=A0A453K9H3_AEGTS
MEFKHLCLVRFKEGVVVEDIIEELTKLAAELDTVKFFGWYVCICIALICIVPKKGFHLYCTVHFKLSAAFFF